MLKKIIFLIVFSLGLAKAAFAQVSISEIMYDLDGADIDFVEVENTSDADLDLAGLKLYVSNSTSNHGIFNYSGSSTLAPNAFGVVVVNSSVSNYVSKWGNSGNIFTASFSLPNTSGTVEINAGDKNSPLDSVSYSSSQGAAGNGKSLQKINGDFVAASPTPGMVNSADNGEGDASDATGDDLGSDDVGDENENNSGSSSSGSGSSVEEEMKFKLKPKAEIKGSNTVFIKIPTVFKPNVINLKGEEAKRGKFVWNFGDGSTIEAETDEEVKHIYDYPGDYAVTLSYYPSILSVSPDLESKLAVKVMESGVSINRTGEIGDFFVELFNNAKYEINLSGWILNSRFKSFYIPRGTILLPGKKIIFSPKVTGFGLEDKSTLKLLYSNGQVAYVFMPMAPLVSPKSKPPPPSLPLTKGEEKGGGQEEIEPEKLSASAINSIPKDNPNLLYLTGLAGLIILGIASIFLFKRNSTSRTLADDFEITE